MYSTPVIKKGRELTQFKGIKRRIEEAKQSWYIEYHWTNEDGSKTRIRDKQGINTIKHFEDKEKFADKLLLDTISKLANGFNPLVKEVNIERDRKVNSITILEATELYLEYHRSIKSKLKTIASYKSKLTYLSEYYPLKKVKDITATHLEDYVRERINEEDGWSDTTVATAKRYFVSFFNFLIKEKYLESNPASSINKSTLKSFKDVPDIHVPYSDNDLKALVAYATENDRYLELVIKIIYYTCLRPSEIKGLQLKDINLQKNIITVPLSVRKNTKTIQKDIIVIDRNLRYELDKLNLSEYPRNYYLISNSTTIVGANKTGENTPYNKIAKALKVLNLDNLGYDLYSIKHTANIRRYTIDNWSLAAIMKLNRHSSISQTEEYLKGLTNQTDISSLFTTPI